MVPTAHTLQKKLGKAIGHKLRKVVGSVHFFDTEELSDASLCLWLFFETLTALRLAGAPDGWGLLVDEHLPEPMDLGESGEVIIRDLSQRSVFKKVLGEELQGAWTVHTLPQGDVVGIRFDFGQSIQPLVLNWGDELYMAGTYPDDARDNDLQERPIVPG